jgi:hypothetical protein
MTPASEKKFLLNASVRSRDTLEMTEAITASPVTTTGRFA